MIIIANNIFAGDVEKCEGMDYGQLNRIRLRVVLRRFYIKRKSERFFGWAIGIIQSGVECVGVAEFAANVHGEFEFPAHGFNDAGRCNFAAI
jgi:hypothetical protein